MVSILMFPLRVLKYEALGCYYTLYALLYPFIFVINKLGDVVFIVYKKNDKKKIKLQDIAPRESINLDSGDRDFKVKKEEFKSSKTAEEQFREFYDSLPWVKKAKEREKIKSDELKKLVASDTSRSDKPLTFKYIAKDADGKKEINTFYAYSKIEVYNYLVSEGYMVLSIETSKFIEFQYGPSKFNTYRFNNKDLIFWLTQLSTYIKAGIPLTESMRIISKQMSKTPKKKKLFDAIIYNLTLGEAFSTSLEKQTFAFPALLVSMIKAAEATGELEETLDDMADYYTKLEETRKAMISAMTYPAIITIFSIAVVTFILLYVIPQFKGVYDNAGVTINGFTLFIMSLSNFVDKYIITILTFLLAIVVIIFVLYRNVKSIKKSIQVFAMNIPVFGKIIIYKEMNIFAKTFASLLKNNVFITESVNLLTEITSNEIYKEIMFETLINISKGEKISLAFKDHWAVPDVAYYMIVTGESTGELANMMGKVADYYQSEHQSIINNMKAFIEPAMIIFLAVIVGGIVMAVILPMFSLYGEIM